jgi:deazaflavin-dependent oxidoreductase (nitroreductase family)
VPLPRSVARFNRRVTNHILGPLARYLPGFGVVTHRGRRSGRLYRTPVNVFRRRGSVVVALTYGPDSDWVRNVFAAGECVLETRGRALHLSRPRLIHDETGSLVPRPLRPIGAIGRVADFLELSLDERALTGPRVPAWVPPFNRLAGVLLRAGVPMGLNALITVPGRKTGLPRTTPVTVIEANGRRWVMAPFGEVDWVRNLRAAGRATMTARRHHRVVTAIELEPAERVAFFRDVLRPLVRRYGPLVEWIVRHVDKVDLVDPVRAAEGRPVFELRTLDQTPR